MKLYPIGDNPTETIEVRANENTFALVQRVKLTFGDEYKAIIMNQREVLNLYQAIQKELRIK